MEGCVGDFSLTGPIESESNTEDQVRRAGDDTQSCVTCGLNQSTQALTPMPEPHTVAGVSPSKVPPPRDLY